MNMHFGPDPRQVAVAQGTVGGNYPAAPPFRPATQYPEFGNRLLVGEESNSIYPLCRKLFVDLGFDRDNFGKPSWNPLGSFIKPGDKVLLKPNLVRHIHMGGGNHAAVVTHGSVVRCLLDYVALALQGSGKIVIGDAPVQSANFASLVTKTGLQSVCDDIMSTWGLDVGLKDFRLWAIELDENHCQVKGGKFLAGDVTGYLAVDLGTRSLLAPLAHQHERFRVTSYDCHEMVRHHNLLIHEYLIPRTVLDADVIINLPKLKTHRKVGLTAALKNLVGINGHKDWLPHHRCGSVEEGGDEYPNASTLKQIKSGIEEKMIELPARWQQCGGLAVRVIKRLASVSGLDPYEEGSWYGNDTLWRTVLDLNRLLIYADRGGKMRDQPQRKCFTVVDGIIAGEGEGPMEPDERHCGIIAGGMNPVAVDTILATMVGFDYRKIPIIEKGYGVTDWRLAELLPHEITVQSNDTRWKDLKAGAPCNSLRFVPPSGWIGHIELTYDGD